MPSGDAMDEEKKDEKKAVALDAGDIALLKSYGVGPYAASIKALEADIEGELKKIGELVGVRESETGLAPQSSWDLHADKQMKQEEQPLREWRPLTTPARPAHAPEQQSCSRSSPTRSLAAGCLTRCACIPSPPPHTPPPPSPSCLAFRPPGLPSGQTWAAARRSSTQARRTRST